jgi:hypothetical protein
METVKYVAATVAQSTAALAVSYLDNIEQWLRIVSAIVLIVSAFVTTALAILKYRRK